jgi:hypothetical protein
MHRYWKLLPLLAVMAFGAVFAAWPQSAGATPIAPPTWTGPGTNGYFTITASYTDDTPAGSGTAVLSAIGGVGTFVTTGATVSPQADEVVSASGSTITVTEDSDTIPQTKTITANFQCLAVGTVTFTISHGGTTSATSSVMTCSYSGAYTPPYTGYPSGYGYPGGYGYGSFNPLAPIYNNVVPATATQIGVSASPAAVSCGSAATVAVTVHDANGNPVPDGTAVTLTSSMGTIAPTTGNTAGGSMSGVFTSPGSNGTAVITVSSGSASGQATVTVNCSGAVVGSAQTSAPPPVYAPPPSGAIIYPPNTGDAGLAGQSSGSSRLPAALAVALMVVVGGSLAAGLSNRRAQIPAR